MKLWSYKQNNNKKSSLPLLVMTGMCASVVTIVWQSLAHPSSYQTQSYHWPAFSQNPIGQIEWLVRNQQSWIHDYLQGLFSSSWISDVWSVVWPDEDMLYHSVASVAPWYRPSWADTNDDDVSMMSWAVRYDTFDILKQRLSQQSCDYETPIDNTDPRMAHIIARGLERCLITLSHTRKVNATDHLTHRTMRIIAERAWFVVKHEHMTDAVVSRDRFYSFVYALQQHHQIGDLPVIPISSPVTRIERLSLLYMIFGWVQADVVKTDIWLSLPSGDEKVLIWQQWTMTVAVFKSGLQSQWYDIQIMPYDADIALTPEIMQSIMDMLSSSPSQDKHSSTLSHQSSHESTLSSVGIDKDMIKQSLSRLIEKI